MRKLRRRIPKKYQVSWISEKSGFSKYPHFLPLLGAILGLIIVGAVFLTTDKTKLVPNEYHIVRVFDKGKQQVYPTKEATVGDLLGKLNLNLIPEDVVEPSLDTPIVEDNFRVNIYRAQPVTVVDGTNRIVSLSAQKSARVLAQQAGITVYPEDNVTFQAGSVEQNIIGQKVDVDRATPVNLILYGLNLTVRTHAKTVKDLLAEKQIVLADGDTVSPDPSLALSASTQVVVLRKGMQIATVTEVITTPIQYVDDSSLSFGTNVVRQSGSNGSRVVTYQIKTENGKEVGRDIVQQVVVSEAVPKIVARGSAVNVPTDKTSIMAAAGITIGDYQYVYYIINHENALWCPTRWQGQNFCPTTYAEKFPGAESNTLTGYGLCQSTPGNKMASAGADWRINPVTQLKWCAGYAQKRYGSWEAAYNHWLVSHNW